MEPDDYIVPIIGGKKKKLKNILFLVQIAMDWEYNKKLILL